MSEANQETDGKVAPKTPPSEITEGRVHDLEEEREKRDRPNFLVRGAKAVSRGVRRTKQATVNGVNKVLNGTVNQARKHPLIATTVVAAGAGMGVKRIQEKRREERRLERQALSEEMAETHALQHDQLLEEMKIRGLDETMRESIEDAFKDQTKTLRSSVFAAVNDAFNRTFGEEVSGNGQREKAEASG